MKGFPMNAMDSPIGLTPSQLISNQITELGDWRGELMTQLRQLVHTAVPDIKEEWKWGTAVFSLKGNVFALAAFKDHVKLNFFQGASLADQQSLFNAGLEAKASRAIDLQAGDDIHELALIGLIQAAAGYNHSGGKKE
jgi:hypothetical protein